MPTDAEVTASERESYEATIETLGTRLREQVERSISLALALEDVAYWLEMDHGDTVGDAGCCADHDCGMAESIRLARAMLDVAPEKAAVLSLRRERARCARLRSRLARVLRIAQEGGYMTIGSPGRVWSRTLSKEDRSHE